MLLDDTHLRDVLAQGKRQCREEGYETIQAAATSYVVDQTRGVTDPRGMFCERLGVSVHAVAVRAGPLQNLRLAIERCHLTIARQLYAPYASGLATLDPDELSLRIAALIDGLWLRYALTGRPDNPETPRALTRDYVDSKLASLSGMRPARVRRLVAQ